MQISGPMILQQYRVLVDYKKSNKGELSVKADDVVEVVEKNANGWWFVSADEQQGWVPATCVPPSLFLPCFHADIIFGGQVSRAHWQ